MLNVAQNTWQGRSFFSNPGNQFYGTFVGSFYGNGAGITGILASSVAASGIIPGTFQSGLFLGNAGGTTFGSVAQPIIFVGNGAGLTNINAANVSGTFPNSNNYPNGNFSGAFNGTFTGNFVGVPSLSTNNIWTGLNTFNEGLTMNNGNLTIIGSTVGAGSLFAGYGVVAEFTMICGNGAAGTGIITSLSPGYFAGSGSGLTNIPAAGLTGTIPASVLNYRAGSVTITPSATTVTVDFTAFSPSTTSYGVFWNFIDPSWISVLTKNAGSFVITLTEALGFEVISDYLVIPYN